METVSSSNAGTLKLCVMIPALNEEATIGDVIRRIPKMDGVGETVVVVIDDGSTDRTAELACAAGATVVSHPERKGLSAAFQTGVNHAIDVGADLVVNIDADGQFDPADIPALLQPLIDGKADFVSASRFINPDLRPEMPWVKYMGNMVLARVISYLTGNRFHDVSCGFRAYTADTLLRLNLFGDFTYTQETFLDLSFKGVRIREVPVKVRGVRQFGKSRIASNLFEYAVRSSRIIFRSFSDYRPMRLFGAISAVLFVLAALLIVFLGVHYARTGAFSPHKWAGFTAGYLLATSFMTLVTGLIADMLARVRLNQERMLYQMKKNRR